MTLNDSTTTRNVRFAGLGGTGVIKASDVFADLLFRAGYDVKKAEVHGMSQRGGSITSDVRWGDVVHSPMIPEGECDVLVVLDATQIPVVRPSLKEGGLLLSPADIDTTRLPSSKSLNVALLGRLSRELDLPETAWQESLHSLFATKLHTANDEAFAIGRNG